MDAQQYPPMKVPVLACLTQLYETNGSKGLFWQMIPVPLEI
jgi:hypothetical protein